MLANITTVHDRYGFYTSQKVWSSGEISLISHMANEIMKNHWVKSFIFEKKEYLGNYVL